MKPGETALDLQGWRSWQQRAGNEIGNQLYAEGDYIGALAVYLSLLQLDDTHTWRFPLLYQIGLIHERLEQPQKASEAYAQIVETKMSDTEKSSPSLKLIADMAQWRIDHLAWLARAELATHSLQLISLPVVTGSGSNNPKTGLKTMTPHPEPAAETQLQEDLRSHLALCRKTLELAEFENRALRAEGTSYRYEIDR